MPTADHTVASAKMMAAAKVTCFQVFNEMRVAVLFILSRMGSKRLLIDNVLMNVAVMLMEYQSGRFA